MGHLSRFTFHALLLIWVLLLAPAATASAHNAFPAREVPLTVGQYQYTLLIFNQKINAGDMVQLLLVPDLRNPKPAPALEVLAVPASESDQGVVAARLWPDENDQTLTAADLTIPQQGEWRIEVRASGVAGSGSSSIAVSVAPPPAIPLWAGWLIALTPLLGLVWFGFQQRAMIRRARLEGVSI